MLKGKNYQGCIRLVQLYGSEHLRERKWQSWKSRKELCWGQCVEKSYYWRVDGHV